MNSKKFKRVKEFEEENAQLKQIYANLSLDYELAKEIIEKSFKALSKAKYSKKVYPLRQQQGVSRTAVK